MIRMEFYYSGNKFYKKPDGGSGPERPSLRYAGSQSWDPLKIENEFSKSDIYKNFQFKQWVLLKKEQESWIQDGPYSSQDIFHKIESGEVRTDSMIWKKGLKKWGRLGETDVFKGIFQEIQFDANFELLDSVMELRREVAPQQEERILKNISFALKDYDFSNIPIHLEAKAIRAFPRRGTHIYRSFDLPKQGNRKMLVRLLIVAGFVMLVVKLFFLK